MRDRLRGARARRAQRGGPARGARARRQAAATAVVGVVAVGAACVPAVEENTGAPDPLAEFYGQEIDWSDCEADFECADFEVPLDYEDPDGERLEIAVMRLPASGGDPLGSLVVNPGGPGGSGLEYVTYAPFSISEAVRERFDVVGFDPRGVGESHPIECLDTDELDAYLGMDVEPEEDEPGQLTDDSLEALAEGSERFVSACTERAGELLEHVGTANVARDMDILRDLLGDDQLTYLGKSYGTFIGTHYADQFPERVRAMVLDGAVDPTLSNLELSVQQAEGFETALHAFVTDCQAQDDCPIAPRDAEPGSEEAVAEGVEQISDLIEQAREEPLDNGLGDGREVNGIRVELGVTAALYHESYWTDVRDGLADAVDGDDGTILLQLGDQLYDRQPGGNYENMTAALTAVNCVDRPAPQDVADYEDAAVRAGEDSPTFGSLLAWGSLTCLYWPVEADDQPTFPAEGAAPILVVGTLRDSATPYHWAERLAEELDSGVLLTYDGDGHTAYRMGDQCVDDLVDTYLLETDPPRDGTMCGT